MITDRDIAVGVVAKGVNEKLLTGKDVMSPDVVTIDEADGIHRAVMLMRKYGFSRLPVVDAEGRLLGILSATDLLNVLTHEMRSLVELTRNREAHEREDRAF